MHHALQIPEILLNVFGQDTGPQNLYLEGRLDSRDLAALARTCRTFKDPALDVLWMGLRDLSPLARCLPDASLCRTRFSGSEYTFERPLTQAEWGILQSYTCRIRAIMCFSFGLVWESLSLESTSSIPNTLFPNLRHLKYGDRVLSAIGQLPPCQPLPSLLSVVITYPYHAVHILQHSLKWFSESSPNVKQFEVRPVPGCLLVDREEFTITPEYISGWQHLEEVICPKTFIDMNVLTRLSHIPTLTTLRFLPTESTPTPSDSESPLVFSNLRTVEMSMLPSVSISKLLAHLQLPVIEDLALETPDCPPGCIISLLSTIVAASINHAITKLSINCGRSTMATGPRVPILTLDDMRPIMVLGNLHHLEFDAFWKVSLTDDDLMELASAWPYLEHLSINRQYGWGTWAVKGITPDGLSRLLQTHPSLSHLCLAVDTQEIQVSPDRPLAVLEFNSHVHSRGRVSLDLIDSVIETESVQPMSIWLAGLVPHATHLTLHSWDFDSDSFPHWQMPAVPTVQRAYEHRWKEVEHRAKSIRRQLQDARAISQESYTDIQV